MDAITYGELILTLGDTELSVLELAVSEEPGKHGRMTAGLRCTTAMMR